MLETFAVAIVRASQWLSLSRLSGVFRTRYTHAVFMEVYVLTFSAILTILINVAIRGAWWCAGVAAYRIFDITSYRIYFLLVKSRRQSWDGTLIRRSLLIVFVNLYELVVAFGILYIVSGELMRGGTLVTDPMTAAYFSAVTIATLGYGDITPTGHLSRVVVCCEITSGIVMLTFIVPALLALFAPGAAVPPPDEKGKSRGSQ